MQANSRFRILRVPLYRLLLLGVIVYFLVFGFFMANLGGQPDQGKHLYFSFRFAETWGIPREDPTSAFRITGNTYLYYWLNGVVLKVERFLAPAGATTRESYMLRLVSLCMSAVTLFYLYKLASKVIRNRYAGVLAAFFLANTLMFVFVSSGVSYDNFMTLASAAALYHLVNIYRQEDFLRNTSLMGIWLCLGALAKEQVLLLAFLLTLAWLAYLVSPRKRLGLSFSRTNLVLGTLLVASLVLLVGLYGVNLVRYHGLIPACPQVKSPQACTLFAFRKSLYQPIDIRQLWSERESIDNPFSYAFNFWGMQMLSSIWGIVAHNIYVPWLSISLHGLLILGAALCAMRYWKPEDQTSTVLVLILLTHTAFVLVMNYVSELHYDFRHFAVQGRYLFPVLGVLITLMINYFLRIPSPFLRRLTLILALIIYFAGGFGLFLWKYSQVFSYWRTYF
jgi:4-amino-4-deoxy-L-arabinose transferase-like glycosyltransferase